MSLKSPEENQGYEFDWLASDAVGHVALFSTAGGGYAPEEFLRDTEAHDAAIDAILASPVTSRVCFAPELATGLVNTWRAVAERGVFAFDSDAQGGPYRLVAVPETPRLSAELPGIATTVTDLLVLSHLRFAELSVIPMGLLDAEQR